MTAPKDPEKRLQWFVKLSENTKKQMTPEAREYLRNLRLGKKHTPEVIEKIRIAGTGIKKWPNGRPEMIGNKNPSCREEVKLKKSLKTKGVPRPQCSRPGKLNPMYGKKASTKTKLQMSISHQGSKCYLWKGGISFEPYCIKFSREFKERVRAFFNYQCFECGTPQNGKKLAVHHVLYNKQTCCDDTPPLFVPLCTSCHNLTSNKDRVHWGNYFTSVINNYYMGKCYLSKEEFLCLFP